MKFFADENFEQPIIQRLLRAGHDMATVPAGQEGAMDPVVLALSAAENRVFLTNDKDFAELVFLKRQAAAGVVLVRLPRFSTAAKVERVLEVIEEHGENLLGVFTVIEVEAIRRRPFLRVRKET